MKILFKSISYENIYINIHWFQKIGKIATRRNLPFHVDSCLGGFLLPFCDLPDLEPYDFRVKGVTSISADTHKYGYAPKGSSVILYREKKYLHHQYFMSTDWSGGLCVFPTFAGSRVGSSITGTWAAMVVKINWTLIISSQW